MSIYSKLFEFQNRSVSIKKTKAGASTKEHVVKYKYAPLNEVYFQVMPVLNKLRILLHQTFEEDILVTKLIDVDDETSFVVSITSLWKFYGDGGMTTVVQQYGSAVTYMRRYTILTMLGLAPEDDDGASAYKKSSSFGELFLPNTEDAIRESFEMWQTVDDVIQSFENSGKLLNHARKEKIRQLYNQTSVWTTK